MVGNLWRMVGRPMALAFVLMALWLLLSGYFEKATLLAFGVLSVALCLYLSERAGVLDKEGVPTAIFPGILGYMVWLTLEIGKANIQVAQEVLRPTLRLSPKMIRVPSKQASDVGRTIFANSITLTPGTVTVDVDEESMLIHALTEDLADTDGIEAMGDKVCAFDRPNDRLGASAAQRGGQ